MYKQTNTFFIRRPTIFYILVILFSGIFFTPRFICSALPLTSYVNPFIGSRGGAGFGAWGNAQRGPGANAPFPFMRLSPDTTHVDDGILFLKGEWWSKLNRHAGYFGSDNAIRAFSHTHVQGAGDADLGNVGVMISRTNVSTFTSLVEMQPISASPIAIFQKSPFLSLFTLSDQIAKPGYYSVLLRNLSTNAELTVSGSHAGAHRYTCNYTEPMSSTLPCTFVIDVCHRTYDGPCSSSTSVNITQGNNGNPSPFGNNTWTVTASVNNTGEFTVTGLVIYFHFIIGAMDSMGFPISPTITGTWSNYTLSIGSSYNFVKEDENNLGAFLSFPSPTANNSVIIHARVGISTVSPEAALANLLAEQVQANGTWLAFDDIVSKIDTQWENLLQGFQVTPPLNATTTTDTVVLDTYKQKFQSQVHGINGNEMVLEDMTMSGRHILSTFLSSDPKGISLAAQYGWTSFMNATLKEIQMNRIQEDGIEKAMHDITHAVQENTKYARIVRDQDPLGTDLSIFYTNLYLVYSAPTTYSDADESYLGYDGKIHKTFPNGSLWLSDLSLWDIHRTQAPLLAITVPKVLSSIVSSLMTFFEQGNILPRWPFGNIESANMVGEHAVQVIADCILRFNVCNGAVTLEEAANAVLTAVQNQDNAVPQYAAVGGFAPYPQNKASQTLDFAYDDAIGAAFATAIGNTSLANVLFERSNHFINTWNKNASILAPRYANGTFINDPSVWNSHPFNNYYVEGNAAQYLFAVPHNISGLVSLFPSINDFSNTLQIILTNQSYWTDIFSTFLPNPYTWIGNEPSLLIPWLHAFSNQENYWQVSFWSRYYLRTFWTSTVDGIPGNDDYGTMAAWSIFSYCGLYPIGGMGIFILGSPVFENVTITIPNGYTILNKQEEKDNNPVLTIIAHNASSSNIFVSSVQVNGILVNTPVVTVTQLWPNGLTSTALIEFFMTDTHTNSWKNV